MVGNADAKMSRIRCWICEEEDEDESGLFVGRIGWVEEGWGREEGSFPVLVFILVFRCSSRCLEGIRECLDFFPLSDTTPLGGMTE